jgi:arylsulfatase A-like enzyme
MKHKQKSANCLSRRELLKYGLYGGLVAGLSPSLLLSGCGKRQHAKKPNIILITLDTTRADRLGCYGYRRQTSPNIDKLAEESVLYTRAIAPSSWTLPSHASLFTGKFTSSHGARYDPEGPLLLTDAISGPESWDAYRARGLAQNEVTLAEVLKETGYTTAAVVGGPWMKRIFGLNKGFDYYNDSQISTVNGRLASQVTTSALNWLERRREKKFFLFLNYFDPHGPYSPPEGFALRFLPKGTNFTGREPTLEETNALYDAEILYMDHYIGRFLQKLKVENLYNDTLIIVTSDHGELFGEHGKFGHGHYLYQEELHVPLFIKYPAGEVSPKRTDLRAQLTDILPMIYERVGITIPGNIQGTSPSQIKHPIIAETYPLPLISKDGSWQSIFEGDFKFIWNSKNQHMLFNLKDDPEENVNIIVQDSKRTERMWAQMEQYLAKLPKPGLAVPAGEPDDQTKEALKSLGYVN